MGGKPVREHACADGEGAPVSAVRLSARRAAIRTRYLCTR